jgi:hypothetical protein
VNGVNGVNGEGKTKRRMLEPATTLSLRVGFNSFNWFDS